MLILSPFLPRFFSILALPRILRRLKCATLYTKYKSKKLKHRNQNITQNTMSHIGFRTWLINTQYGKINSTEPAKISFS